MATNLGKWDRWFHGIEEPQAFGGDQTYKLGAEFLEDCLLVEDWGSGKGWLTNHIERERYRGLDGSQTPYADEVVDLADYRSEVPGIFMRHVLEHDYRWEQILTNAVESFTERFVLVLFTPLSEKTHEIAFSKNPGVPDLSFSADDIVAHFKGCEFQQEQVKTESQYGSETVFLVEK